MTRQNHLTPGQIVRASTDALRALGVLEVPDAEGPDATADATTHAYRLLAVLAEHALSLHAQIDSHIPEAKRVTAGTVARLMAELHELRRQLEAAYTERAEVLAFLAAALPSAMSASDEQDPDRPVLMVHGSSGQMSWHIKGEDLPLFAHVDKVLPNSPRTAWDGHTSEEKYRRLRELVGLWASLKPSAQACAEAV